MCRTVTCVHALPYDTSHNEIWWARIHASDRLCGLCTADWKPFHPLWRERGTGWILLTYHYCLSLNLCQRHLTKRISRPNSLEMVRILVSRLRGNETGGAFYQHNFPEVCGLYKIQTSNRWGRRRIESSEVITMSVMGSKTCLFRSIKHHRNRWLKQSQECRSAHCQPTVNASCSNIRGVRRYLHSCRKPRAWKSEASIQLSSDESVAQLYNLQHFLPEASLAL